MTASFNSQTLIAAGRQLEVPFDVQLRLSGQIQTAHCVQLLRLVPERRIVVKLVIGDEAYLGKIFLGPDRGKYCQRERAGILALQAAGISTAKLQGQGCLEDKGGEVLLLEYLAEVQHLSEQLASRQTGVGQQLEAAVGMIAAMHDKGLQHKDCHLDNVLVNPLGLYLIDGDAVEKSPRLSQVDAMENLALFIAQLPLTLDCRLSSLFSYYCGLRGWSQQDHQTRFKHAVQKQRKNRQRRFLKKIYRDCTQIKVAKSWTRFTALDRQAGSSELQALIDNPEHYIEKGQLLKDGNSATVAKVCLEHRVYVVKRYNLKNVAHWLLRFWRPSRAWISWRNAHLLNFYGIPTPKPVALIEQRCGVLRGKAYFITEYVAAENALSHVEKIKADTQALKHLAGQFADLFEAMKLLRMSHGDCKATNFLLERDALMLIDLDSMKMHAAESGFQKAFARDRQRFLRNWSSDVRIQTIMAKALEKIDG